MDRKEQLLLAGLAIVEVASGTVLTGSGKKGEYEARRWRFRAYGTLRRRPRRGLREMLPGAVELEIVIAQHPI
jgi:hypothetical protein